MYFFNPENFGFYLEDGEGFIPLTDEEYRYLIDGQSEGNQIVLGEGGVPELRPIEKTAEEILAGARAARDKLLTYATLRINPLQYASDLDEASEEDQALLKLWKKYSSAVNKTETKPGWPEAPAWPEPPIPIETSA